MGRQLGCCVVGLAKGEKPKAGEGVRYPFRATADNSLADVHRAQIAAGTNVVFVSPKSKDDDDSKKDAKPEQKKSPAPKPAVQIEQPSYIGQQFGLDQGLGFGGGHIGSPQDLYRYAGW